MQWYKLELQMPEPKKLFGSTKKKKKNRQNKELKNCTESWIDWSNSSTMQIYR